MSSVEAGIDKYELFKQIGYKPHSAAQLSIHQSDSRFKIPCCGRRFGKSQSVGHEITGRMFVPDTINWIVGPTYKLGEKEFRVVHDDLVRKLKFPSKHMSISYNVKQGDMRIYIKPFNSLLEVVSASHSDSLVGEGLNYACMSEAALHSMNTWQMYIEPALSDHLGDADFPSTPRGYNWYFGLYQLGQDPTTPEYQSWRFPTWENEYRYPGGFDPMCSQINQDLNYHATGGKRVCECNEELVRIYNNVSIQYWEQEYAASFTSFEGKIYPDFSPQTHVRRIEYNPAWKNYQAYDFGFTDPFVCLDIMVDQMDNVYIWREYQVRQKTTWEHAQIIKNRENPEGYHVTAMFADPRGADEIATLALVLGGCYANPTGWITGVEVVRRWMKVRPDGQPKLFIDPSCRELIRQLESLRGKAVQEGKNTKDGQHDYDDHGPDAMRYFFNEWQIHGAGGGLADTLQGGYHNSEAAGFFTMHTQTKLESPIGYY